MKFLAPFEVQLIQAGNLSGQLPEILQRLAELQSKKNQRMLRLLLKLAYPILLLHLAILAPSVSIYMQQGAAAYGKTVLPALLLLYAVLFLPLLFLANRWLQPPAFTTTLSSGRLYPMAR